MPLPAPKFQPSSDSAQSSIIFGFLQKCSNKIKHKMIINCTIQQSRIYNCIFQFIWRNPRHPMSCLLWIKPLCFCSVMTVQCMALCHSSQTITDLLPSAQILDIQHFQKQQVETESNVSYWKTRTTSLKSIKLHKVADEI